MSAWGLVATVAALTASVALSYFGDAGRRGVDVCSSSGTSSLVGFSLLALAGATVLAVPGVWATVRVFRANLGPRFVAPRAVGVVLIVFGLPVALLSFLASAFSYACLF